MTEFLTLDIEELFQRVVERGRMEGVATQEGYNTLVDEEVQEKLEVGEMDEDSSTVGLVAQLRNRWPDYQEALGLGDSQPQL